MHEQHALMHAHTHMQHTTVMGNMHVQHAGIPNLYPLYHPCAVTSICAKCTEMLCGYFHHVLVVGTTHTAVDMLEMLCMLNLTCIDHLSYH